MDIKELNEFYFQLQMRCNVLMLGLQHRILETEGEGTMDTIIKTVKA